MSPTDSRWNRGLLWALMSPLFLGVVPITAKIAYQFGVDVVTVAALRTILAAAVLWAIILLFAKQLAISSTPAMVSSMLVGAINGVGSLFYYSSISRIDASLGQLINITYLIFVTILLRLLGQRISKLTLGRMGLAIVAIYLLTRGGTAAPDWVGVGFMLIAALSYAIQLVFSQRIMVDIPAPTMAVYAMTGMAAVVGLAWLVVRPPLGHIAGGGWAAVGFMGLATAASRLTLFLGVKHLGSLQAALLSVGEMLVTVILAMVWLDETLTMMQIAGALLLITSILLVKYEQNIPNFDWWAILYKRWAQRE